MPSSTRRGLTVISLVLWLMAVCSGHLMELHVSMAHAGGQAHEVHDLPAMLGHADTGAHSEHDHEFSSDAEDPATTAPRLQPLPLPGLALLPVEWSASLRGAFDLPAPRPRPRTKSPGLQNLNILRI